jgi:hypothetical protein
LKSNTEASLSLEGLHLALTGFLLKYCDPKPEYSGITAAELASGFLKGVLTMQEPKKEPHED